MSSYSVVVSSIKELEWSEKFKEHKEIVLDFMRRFYEGSEYPVVVTEKDNNQILFEGKSRIVRIFKPEADGNFDKVRILVDKTKKLEFVSPKYFACTWEDAEKDEPWHYFEGTVKDTRHLQMREELLILMDEMKQALADGVDFSPTSIISLVTQTLGITEDELEYFKSSVLTIKNRKIIDAQKRQGDSLIEQETEDCVIVVYQNDNFTMTKNETKQIIDEVTFRRAKASNCLEVLEDCFEEGREAINGILQEIAVYNQARK